MDQHSPWRLCVAPMMEWTDRHCRYLAAEAGHGPDPRQRRHHRRGPPAAIRAAKQATTQIPIVMAFWGGSDPVESGIVASLARPGGNLTGVHMMLQALDAKRSDERADALLIGATAVNVALRPRWLAFAAEQRLPTMAPYRQFGAMLSYGPDPAAIFRRAAEFVAKILGGERPGELPMEQPTRFELVVNLKTAKALGLTIPYTVMLRATEVID